MRTWAKANRTLKYKVGDRIKFVFPPNKEPREALITKRDRSVLPYRVEWNPDKEGDFQESVWLLESEIVEKIND